MIDFHTHILPGIDDGAKTVEDSIQILNTLETFGIDIVCLTPHFYASRRTVERFLEKRQNAYDSLVGEYKGNIKLLLGSEVCYYSGISNLERIDELKLEGTNLLLLEMPSVPWNDLTIREVLTLNARDNTTVVLAHVERYLGFQKKETVDALKKAGVLFQSNYSYFRGLFHRKKAMKDLEDISFIATDVHCIDTLKHDKKVIKYLKRNGLEQFSFKELKVLYENEII